MQMGINREKQGFFLKPRSKIYGAISNEM